MTNSSTHRLRISRKTGEESISSKENEQGVGRESLQAKEKRQEVGEDSFSAKEKRQGVGEESFSAKKKEQTDRVSSQTSTPGDVGYSKYLNISK